VLPALLWWFDLLVVIAQKLENWPVILLASLALNVRYSAVDLHACSTTAAVAQQLSAADHMQWWQTMSSNNSSA
jgi:hypothetical protein